MEDKGIQEVGVRLGNWFTAEQAHSLWQLPNAGTLKSKRDRAILAVLLGCGLRRRELSDLTLDHLQRREEHATQMGRIIRTAAEPQATLYWLAAETGLRAGELAGLRKTDLDLANRRLSVEQSIGQVLQFEVPSVRYVGLPSETVETGWVG